MIHNIRGIRVAILGDPHLGKAFVNGVPLDRRGEREQQQWYDFQLSLHDVENADMHVNMGDIFDKMIVSPNVTLDAALEYIQAAQEHPDVTYVILRGNHDGSRDADQRASFDLFKAIVEPERNILVVDQPGTCSNLGFVPWDPFKSAAELTRALGDDPLDAIFGHWDLDSFGDEQAPNLVPVGELLKRTDTVFNGHVHLPETRYYDTDGHPVKSPQEAALTLHNVGSMQPYTHAEDRSGERYVTLTLDQLQETDPAGLRDKCVRVLLQPGEELPGDLECLQLTGKPVSERDDTEDPNIEVEPQAFDFTQLFRKAFAQQGVREDVRDEVWGYYQETTHAEET